MAAWLKIEQGEGSPPALELKPGAKVTLGRHRNNAIVVRDEHVSRHHAVVQSDRACWYISSIGDPINGTRVNGQIISTKTELRDQDEIAIGETRLRFALQDAEPSAPGCASDGSSFQTVPFLADELTVLCAFLARSLEETDARNLVQHALETIHAQTRASVVGFISLVDNEPLPRLIFPGDAAMDADLSRQLTHRVEKEGRTVWLAAEGRGQPLGDSLGLYNDAMCLPLRVTGAALGALHVYKAEGVFCERHCRLCEALAGYLASSLNVLRARRSLEAENVRLRSQAVGADDLVGSGPAIQALRKTIAKAAPRPSIVLIRGESGVGKELVALALHRQSPRRDGPLVVVNCAAIAATLPEAELFGHCKGAFTGADRDRLGLFQQADEGTLFLDEVGDLPLDCQAKLLRIIEGHGFRAVGASREVRVDVRIIAATNRDLEEQVRKGTFRQDLLFRMQVIQIQVPPLRQRPEDIPQLVRYFLDKLTKGVRRPIELTAAALGRLQGYSWPGNVRQLRAVLESAVALAEGNQIDEDDLSIPADAAVPSSISLNLDELETWAIRQALHKTKGNVSQAARLLGVVRDTLSSKMKKKGIDRAAE